MELTRTTTHLSRNTCHVPFFAPPSKQTFGMIFYSHTFAFSSIVFYTLIWKSLCVEEMKQAPCRRCKQTDCRSELLLSLPTIWAYKEELRGLYRKESSSLCHQTKCTVCVAQGVRKECMHLLRFISAPRVSPLETPKAYLITRAPRIKEARLLLAEVQFYCECRARKWDMYTWLQWSSSGA